MLIRETDVSASSWARATCSAWTRPSTSQFRSMKRVCVGTMGDRACTMHCHTASSSCCTMYLCTCSWVVRSHDGERARPLECCGLNRDVRSAVLASASASIRAERPSLSFSSTASTVLVEGVGTGKGQAGGSLHVVRAGVGIALRPGPGARGMERRVGMGSGVVWTGSGALAEAVVVAGGWKSGVAGVSTMGGALFTGVDAGEGKGLRSGVGAGPGVGVGSQGGPSTDVGVSAESGPPRGLTGSGGGS
mmetsp:Transcript_41205/g.73900  ORF Transcript_41205/g.73900 Transcript_41205/m.73900 type:complete len:248 (-) Transcript_41205:2455-3198(-)